MPNRKYQKGYRFENKLVNDLKKGGYDFVCRSAGSHSPFDVIAIKEGMLLLIQCKANELTEGEEVTIAKNMPYIQNSLNVFKVLAFKKGNKRNLKVIR